MVRLWRWLAISRYDAGKNSGYLYFFGGAGETHICGVSHFLLTKNEEAVYTLSSGSVSISPAVDAFRLPNLADVKFKFDLDSVALAIKAF